MCFEMAEETDKSNYEESSSELQSTTVHRRSQVDDGSYKCPAARVPTLATTLYNAMYIRFGSDSCLHIVCLEGGLK